jgi:hypothetical protein
VPIPLSLGVILALIAGTMLLSLIVPTKTAGAEADDHA